MKIPLKIACIDLEGVLTPEIWPFISQQTAIPALSLTTREYPNYYALMKKRIAILRKHNITLEKLESMISDLQPLPGAVDFLNAIRQYYDIQIISDCFHEIADGILTRLGNPVAMCHRFIMDNAGFIVDCAFAPRRGKEDVVTQFLDSGATVLAVGDAFNDIAMLEKATYGFLINPSSQTRMAAPHLRTVNNLSDITSAILMQEKYPPRRRHKSVTTHNR